MGLRDWSRPWGGDRRHRLLTLTLSALLCSAAHAASAAAAGEPVLGASWTTDVSTSSATFHGEIDPEGSPTTYRFEYATDAAFQEKGFTGASKAPAGGAASAGSGSVTVAVLQHVSALRAATLYHYRLSATNEFETVFSPPATFTTQEITGSFRLPDGRGWEMVSPADKNGGAIQGYGQNHGGGVLQAAAAGNGEITYSSASSFGGYEALGAPQGSQYISRRQSTGWTTENITTPVVSGSYGNEPNGVPYQLFSADLSRGLLLNGVHCRGEGSGCPVANSPLPGTEAPAGYQNYYLRDDVAGTFQAAVTEANSELALDASEFDLAFAGSDPALRHPVFSTCATLTEDAVEIAGLEGCDPAEQNLYRFSEGQLELINFLPGQSSGAPGATLAAQAGAVSTSGQRVYFAEAGNLYLREGGATVQVDEEVGGGAQFQTATPDGAYAFFTKAGHLYRYKAQSEDLSTIDLTPSGGVAGVLGASADGSSVYYVGAGGALFLWHSGTVTEVAEGSAESDYPPTTGTARVSADGSTLVFLSKEALTGYDNTDAVTGLPDTEVFVYRGGALACVSCNPTGERPSGPSTIPGAIANGLAPGSADSYKPRVLSASGTRIFFDSRDALVALDTNKASDVYQWETQGTGLCQSAGGCLNLISSGSDSEGASFVDASESGDDTYFLTFQSLVPSDPGSADVYDARVGGGFAVPPQPIPCEGDACQPLPAAPEDPTVGSLIPGPGNPPVHFPSTSHKCPKGKRKVVRQGKVTCVPRHHKKKHRKGKKR